MLLYVGDLIYYYYYDMDYVVVALGDKACVLVIIVAIYFHVSLGVRDFIIVVDRRCILLL